MSNSRSVMCGTAQSDRRIGHYLVGKCEFQLWAVVFYFKMSVDLIMSLPYRYTRQYVEYEWRIKILLSGAMSGEQSF